MLEAGSAAQIAEIYELGDDPVLAGPVARGEVGQVWRLATSRGAFAVKEPFEQPSVAEADDDAAFQDAVRATGVLMPAVVRTGSGDVVAEVDDAHVRMYDWVELGERDARLDPATVGRLVASIHQVRYIGHNSVDPWYTDPIGADRWDDLVRQLAAAGAPFAAQLADRRDEIVALENLLEPPGRSADVPSRSVRGQRPTHSCGHVVRDRLGEQRPRRPRAGAGTPAVRVQLW